MISMTFIWWWSSLHIIPLLADTFPLRKFIENSTTSFTIPSSNECFNKSQWDEILFNCELYGNSFFQSDQSSYNEHLCVGSYIMIDCIMTDVCSICGSSLVNIMMPRWKEMFNDIDNTDSCTQWPSNKTRDSFLCPESSFDADHIDRDETGMAITMLIFIVALLIIIPFIWFAQQKGNVNNKPKKVDTEIGSITSVKQRSTKDKKDLPKVGTTPKMIHNNSSGSSPKLDIKSEIKTNNSAIKMCASQAKSNVPMETKSLASNISAKSQPSPYQSVKSIKSIHN